MKSKGFTLIELLVVIAIIGILASVVLASLNTARAKGADAAIKSGLANARAQAELFYDANSNTYAGVCDTAAVNGVKSINDMVQGAATAAGAGVVTVGTNGSPATQVADAVCNDSSTAWAASVPLKSVSGFWCVDSTGKSASSSAISTEACN